MDQRDLGERVAEIAALDQPIRQELYALLSRGDAWVSRDEAAEALGIARSVAAFHLDRLEEAGLAEVRFERPPGRGGPGAGRPAKRYRRSAGEVAVSLPDRRYDLAGTVLADAVSEAESSGRPVAEAVAGVARRTGCELGEAARRALPRARTRAGVRSVVMAALTRLGYEPRERDGEVVLANCPFHALAERHRSLVCGMNLDLLSGVAEGLGASDRIEPRLEPADGMCCVRLHVR